MTIVFLFDYPFSERDKARFGIDLLRQNGFAVEIWDITAALHREVHARVTVSDPVDALGYRTFTSTSAILAAVGDLPRDAFLFMVVYYQLQAIPLYRAIKRRGLGYGVVVANALPRPAVPSAGVGSFLSRAARLTPSRVLWYFVRRLPFQRLNVPAAALVVAGGQESLASQHGFYPVDDSSAILWAHTFDYDHYLQEMAQPRRTDPRQGVFLDEYLPFHPDYVYLGIDPVAGADEYYPTLRAFFDRVERERGARITIAAHPRSKYEKHPDFFGGRPTLRGRTAELMHTAGFVIAHSSTSLNFAVLFEKPVIFTTNDAIERSPGYGRYVHELAAWFGKTPINLDTPRPIDWDAELSVNHEAYRRYRNAYIKRDGSPDRLCWQIVADRLAAPVPSPS